MIIPTGGGSNVLGCEVVAREDSVAYADLVASPLREGTVKTIAFAELGFDELKRAGEIAKVPRLFLAQPLQCSPIATEVRRDEEASRVRSIGVVHNNNVQ